MTNESSSDKVLKALNWKPKNKVTQVIGFAWIALLAKRETVT
jgi:hypothetical protein